VGFSSRKNVGEMNKTKTKKKVPNVALADEDARVVDRASEALLVDTGLEAAIKEVLNVERESVVELVLGLIEDTITVEAAENGST